MRVAYIRVSTKNQKIERQEVLMELLKVEKVFIEKLSGKNTERPVLLQMIAFLREGDILVVEAISRFARNTKDLLGLIEQLQAKGVEFVSIKEKIDTNTATGRFMLTVFAAVAELERGYLLDRQREGIEIAKEKGVYKGRTRIEPDKTNFELIYTQWKNNKITATQAMKLLGLKRNTFYRRVKEFESI